jgi:hypothetical protein
MVLAGICLWLANLITLVQDVNDEVSFLLNQCKENNGTCETKEPNFITLYISMVSLHLYYVFPLKFRSGLIARIM